MDYHYSDLYERDEKAPVHQPMQPESNGTLALRIAELTRQLSTLQRDFDLMKADRDRLLDEMAKRWPDTKRIDAIGQNGNTGEHYVKVSI